MNYVTTNIRISEEDYLKLKAEAAKKRKSLSAVIRERLSGDIKLQSNNAKNVLERLNNLAKRDAQDFKDIDGVSIIREMRYEDAL